MQNAAEKEGWSQSQADFMIALVATAWGSSYVMMKVGLEGIPPLSLTALRFGIAFVCIAAIFPKELKKTTPRILKRSGILGAFLFGIFVFLLNGMETTTASNAGFLISTSVVMVPVFHALLTRRFPGKRIVIGVAITIVGIGFLSLQESLAFHSGDLLCLVGAFMYTCQILSTPEHAALLFSLEPVSSAAFAFVFLHEVLNLQGMIGAALVLSGVLFASVKKDDSKSESE